MELAQLTLQNVELAVASGKKANQFEEGGEYSKKGEFYFKVPQQSEKSCSAA